MKTRLMTWCLAALLVAACKTESFAQVGTSHVTANIEATATGVGSTDVSASFRDGALSLTFLQLTGDDHVQVVSGSTSHAMNETSLLGVVTYSAQVPVDTAGMTFTVSLTRTKDSGAPSSVATLPAEFSLSASSGSFSRAAAGPTLTWSNATSDPMTVRITGDCIDELSETLPSDATSYTVAANALKRHAGTSVPDSCTATATVDRRQPGALDPAFAGGNVTGIQRRTAAFTTAP